MAGSQLKQLKAALKEKGLIGQSNISKKKAKKTKNDVDRDLKQQNLQEIRHQFNKFDTKLNKSKKDFTVIRNGKFVKVNDNSDNIGHKKGLMQNQMKSQYELERNRKNKNGGLIDRRFGENDQGLSKEEKMLARFTRERQAQGKKRNLYSLESDEEEDDDNDGFTLTHAGQSLSLDDEDTIKYVDEDQQGLQPPKKKSKAEVMKEVIAKSKFYKQQRQKEFAKTQDNIQDLDDEFDDIMGDLREAQSGVKNAFSQKKPEEIEYDNKVRELNYDRRAVPADRTETQEEIEKKFKEKQEKLEADRLRRMEGMEEREQQGDDLEDDFWNNSEEEEEVEEEIDEEEVESNSKVPVEMPITAEEFIQQMDQVEDKAKHIQTIINSYKPNLAPGNKEKMNIFVSILFNYILHLANNFTNFDKELFILIKLAESYNEKLVEVTRNYINELESRINDIKPQDLIFFSLIGYLFSTSDHYHLVVTPCLILMNEILTNIIYQDKSIVSLSQGVFICDVLLKYQRFSKRIDPEIINFIEQSMLLLLPDVDSIDKSKFLSSTNVVSQLNMNEEWKETSVLSVKNIFDGKISKSELILKLVSIMDECVNLWKDKSLVEILESFINILTHINKYHKVNVDKFIKLHKIAKSERKPLTLQVHKSISIPLLTPTFEENFNPDKKSYDINKDRQELQKIQYELKKEKKAALKDIRSENRFLAREQIKEKKDMYDEYHKKMANIVNSIQNEEGSEKNKYERERKQRKNKR
ncbi:unnamed protein product [Candida verbasci]|uniref:Nop14-like protein n=1 Tax=Candida verbasci TaxID=1227364 RepID=A0A9W4TYB8_9ASCO|nr:unnamed protein product [Candida verbasci]